MRVLASAIVFASACLFMPAPGAAQPAGKEGAPPAGAAAAAAKAGKKGARAAGKRGLRDRKGRSSRVGPETPIATFPGFRMLEDGSSRVFVEISRKIEVTEHKAEGQITYRLKGAAAPIRTNRLPLFTAFFPTVVQKAQLVENGDDLDLVIDLRVPSAPKHEIVEAEGGFVLEVDFPRLAGMRLGPQSEQPAAEGAAGLSHAKRTTSTTTLKQQSEPSY